MRVFVLLFLLLLQFSTHLMLSSSSPTSRFCSRKNIEYIRRSCAATIYRRLCYRSLSIYASKIDANPRLLVRTALNVTLRATKSTSRLMRKLSRIHGLRPREAAAMADCLEVIGDSVSQIRNSLVEVGHIIRNDPDFALAIGDIQTWVSAALTDEDTCMDGFEGKAMNGYVKTKVRRHIIKVAHYTSNALALINRFASTQDNPS